MLQGSRKEALARLVGSAELLVPCFAVLLSPLDELSHLRKTSFEQVDLSASTRLRALVRIESLVDNRGYRGLPQEFATEVSKKCVTHPGLFAISKIGIDRFEEEF